MPFGTLNRVACSSFGALLRAPVRAMLCLSVQFRHAIGAFPLRPCSTSFTHVDEKRQLPKMVDVSQKETTFRTATATCTVTLPRHVIARLLEGPKKEANGPAFRLLDRGSHDREIVGPKGPIFATAVVAGVQSVKKTSELIPFCHPLMIEQCNVDIRLENDSTISVECTVGVTHKTGVEMEALTGAKYPYPD
jgi:cyclic pyranopterin phosphate synthase